MDDSSLIWDDGALVTIDQRGLPHEVRELRLRTVDEVIEAITTLAIRGAPAIGIAGAFGVVIATRAHTHDGVPGEAGDSTDGIPDNGGSPVQSLPGETEIRTRPVVDVAAVQAEADRIAAARPTAVNLAWAVDRVRGRVADGADAVLAETLEMLAEDGRVNLAAATHAADLVQHLCGARPLRLLTHCNTGRLATSAVGTAIGALRVLHERGVVEDVIVDETRPLLQGARLTAWELAEAGIPHRLTIDSAAAWAMATGQVDAVLVGADRITANGDVANKIGTFTLALAARHHGIPFIVVAPESTRDTAMATGAQIVVEQRAAAEVTGFGGVDTAPAGTAVFNPAFDVTPTELVTAVVTENGVVYRNSDTYAEHGRASAATVENPDRPLAARGQAIAATARQLYERGWMPGTAGNISVRVDPADTLVTASGLSKGELGEDDTVLVAIADTIARPGQSRKPSAETSIHTAVYRTRPAGAVVHVHSPFATALATTSARPGGAVTPLRISGFELLKGFGLTDPSTVVIPVFPNWPEVARIGADIDTYLSENPDAPPILFITGHGITTWGDTLAQARDRAECLEALCELIARTGRTDAMPLEIGPT
ncbi:bifunctional S-methyl-5-thioribose-1-phosphate isomerase/methylthioribulose 1-phosphate dehydratase [Nocardia salmonicida]|uniref:bifunctional S-methyl-5-thioribose-1-phosphate isomerase/methylthioribulose 1-phosphate dehydratase n=1 Tax=Nocardia salmonicida TaxID=53431 RepID=UPI0007A3A7AC|nr:bifunctional S-methyl-5-thioribose-1-phosphate isomerase/methylthioribulose 1-phosphate dehydratase [Nocardia salmonicida]